MQHLLLSGNRYTSIYLRGTFVLVQKILYITKISTCTLQLCQSRLPCYPNINPLSTNPTKSSKTLKQFYGNLPDELFDCV